MKAKRKRHDVQFKARVALEALKGIKTVQQIAREFDLHPVQVSYWKKKPPLATTWSLLQVQDPRRPP
jgi:transposase